MIFKNIKDVNLPGLYILVYKDGCKIGMSKNVGKRMGIYTKNWCKQPENVYFFYTKNPKKFEKTILTALKAQQEMGLEILKNCVWNGEYIKNLPIHHVVSEINAILNKSDIFNMSIKFNKGFAYE